MTKAEQLQEYVRSCGLNVNADGKTLLLYQKAVTLDDLKKDIDYYVNLKYKQKIPGQDGVYNSYSGVFVIDEETRRLKLFAPIYECGVVEVCSGIAAATGHEQCAVIILNKLEDSFSFHTR